MIATNFLKYFIVDYYTDQVIRPAHGFVLDYADDTLDLICFKSIETVETELFNAYEMRNYKVLTPISYQVINKKIKIIRT